MTQPLVNDLAARWRQNPTAAATIALCDALHAVPDSPLVDQVGEAASRQHAKEAPVLLSVAKMYVEAQKLAEAQALLVNAGKLAPRDAEVYRLLGEVLLRRGDADRADKVLARAIQLGARAAEVNESLERARALKSMQAQAGTRAVAAEVAHAKAPPARATLDSESETVTRVLPPSVREMAARPAPAPPTRVPLPAPPPRPAAVPPPAPARPRPAPPSEPLVSPSPQPRFARDVETASPAYKLPVPAPTAPPIPVRSGPPFEWPSSPTNGRAAGPATAPPGPETPAMVPHPRDVLDAFSLSGIFEPPDGTSPSSPGRGQHMGDRANAALVWDRAAEGPRKKGVPAIVASMVLFVGASTGIYYSYRHMRAQQHVAAEAMLAAVEAQISAGNPSVLADTEAKLSQAFQLESRSQRAALDWARERALVCTVKSGADVGFEDAMGRAKDLGVPEERYAFAKVDSFLYQGDTAGALGVIAKWDGPAGGDAWFQLSAGATFERAGDARARDRYSAATELDPQLFVAHVAQARATAIEGDAQVAMKLAKGLRIAQPDRAEPVALVALAWGRDPRRDDASPPPEVDDVVKREPELPEGLRFVPHAVLAIRAIAKRNMDDARAEIEKGLTRADSPGAAVWLGTISLPLGDAVLARRAALAALQLSAAYEPARALAAHVALLGDRLDEALKATEELEPTSPDVAVVRAAVAYERVDADAVSRALGALPVDVQKLPFLSGLSLAADAIAGKAAPDARKLADTGADEAPWGDLVAMDFALDGGDLATGDKIAASWGKEGEHNPLRAIRLARLARYEGRLDAADVLSQTALDQGTVTPRVLWERGFLLVAKGRPNEVGPLLGRYPLVLGPLATWLSAYASASNGSNGGIESAKGKIVSVDPPPATAPLGARVLAAAAFGAMKEKHRGVDYVEEVLASGNLHPDLVAAALALGFHKVDRGKRKPTYSQ